MTSYNSKEELFKEFNKHAQNRKLKITLNNDSTFVVPFGAIIKNDVGAMAGVILGEIIGILIGWTHIYLF